MKTRITIMCLLVSACAKAQLDTLSYASGYLMTTGILSEKSECLSTEEYCREYIRGIDDNMPRIKLPADSAFIINYSLGAMQSVFIGDSFEHTQEEQRPPVDCIVSGLRMVADGRLDLPGDTIEANAFIRSFPDSVNPVELPEKLRCRFFTAYGIMKGMQPGLQQYIDSFKMNNIKANQSYFALGMADVLSMLVHPQTAYDFGKVAALSCFMELIHKDVAFVRNDFISGARAALKLEGLKISLEELNRLKDCLSHAADEENGVM